MFPFSAYAPGRIELLGNHTDYNQGVALAAAIDRGLTVAGDTRVDNIVSLTSVGHIEVSLGRIQPQSKQPWANYPLGVAKQMQRAGYEIQGFEANISSDLPSGVGLASSAALEVATAGFLMKLHGLRIEPIEVAKLCQRAENEFVGVQSGLLDQATSIFGRVNHLVYLDCQTDEVRTVPFPADFALVIVDSGVKHSLIQSQYNARREECSAAAKALGLMSLREISVEQLEEIRVSIDPISYRRAAHIAGENDRVMRAIGALGRNDAIAIGRLMNASHESSRLNFENSTPELDLLVSISQSLPGVLGSRLTGGGFGGGTVSLVRKDQAADVIERLCVEYRKRSGFGATGFVCHIGDGAAVSW